MIVQNNLQVDHWITEYKENKITGEDDLIETYGGKIDIKKTEEYTYLGLEIDSVLNFKPLQMKLKKKTRLFKS